MPLVNAKAMVKAAFENGYAVAHINTNNLEWTKAILTSAQETATPIIIGTSEGAIKYMGGLKTCYALVASMVDELKITVPVALHLDHGSFNVALEALKAGYTSVMYDGSHGPFAENLANAEVLIAEAKKTNASVEVEIGTLLGEEDGIIGQGQKADPDEVKAMAKAGADMIAAGINNMHGPYPEGWTGLDFDTLAHLQKIQAPIVLHGGSGIPEEQIKKAISLGVAKINVNTELQLAFAEAIRAFVRSGKSDQGKNYDPRKFLAPGYEAMKSVVKDKFAMFGSLGKAA